LNVQYNGGMIARMTKPKTRPETRPRLVAATFRLPADLLAMMAHIRDRDGTPASQQVQRALRAWLKARKAKAPTPDRRDYGTARPGDFVTTSPPAGGGISRKRYREKWLAPIGVTVVQKPPKQNAPVPDATRREKTR
jgi:hypothetical protein